MTKFLTNIHSSFLREMAPFQLPLKKQLVTIQQKKKTSNACTNHFHFSKDVLAPHLRPPNHGGIQTYFRSIPREI